MITGLLLAAGESRRFGSRKLLHLLPDGTSIGLCSATRLLSGVDRAIAVVPPGERELARLLGGAGLEVNACARSSQGMGASLACGVRASRDSLGWVIALADMPFIRPETIARVAQALRDGAPIAAPVFQDRRGHPVGMSREYYAELEALKDDVGARHIVNRDRSRIVLVVVDDDGIHRDIDTPCDLLP